MILVCNLRVDLDSYFLDAVCIVLEMCVCRNFVEEKLGVQYTESRKMEFARSFKESGPASPVFFILSPGVDPLKDVESLGKAACTPLFSLLSHFCCNIMICTSPYSAILLSSV